MRQNKRHQENILEKTQVIEVNFCFIFGSQHYNSGRGGQPLLY